MAPTIPWTQPPVANGPTFGLEYYAGIISHYGMILGALGIVAGFAYMYMLHDPDSKKKGIKIVLGSAIALVGLAFLPALIDQFFVPSASSFGLNPPATGGFSLPSGSAPAPASSSWLGNLMNGAIAWIFGSFVSGLLTLVTVLLQGTIFHTVSLLNGSDSFAQTVWKFYTATAPIATGILAIILAYSFTKQAAGASLLETGHAFDRSGTDPRILIPRAIAAIAMAWGGYYVVAFLLEINNYFVSFFLYQATGIMTLGGFAGSMGSLLGGLAVGTAAAMSWAFIWPFLLLAMIGVFLWIVFSYFIRLFEITFLTALLPVAASFWTLSETSNIWATYIAELLAAIFLQSLQVFLWWVVVQLISGGGVSGGNIFGGLSDFFMGLIGMYFVARAPNILRGFLGHNVAGGQTLGGEVMAALAMRSAGKAAWQASPISKVAGALKEGKSQEAEQTVRNWSRQSVRPSLLDKPVGAVGRFGGAMAGTVANYADGFRGGMDAGVGAFAEGGPLGVRFTRAARAAYRGVQTGSGDTGRVSRFGEAGAAAANFRPTTAAGRVFAQMERRGDLARSQNELGRAQRLEEVPDIAQNQYAARVTRQGAESGAMLQRPDLAFKGEMAKQDRINAALNIWTGKSEGIGRIGPNVPVDSEDSREQRMETASQQGTRYAQELGRARDENRGLFKERRQLSRRFRGEVGQTRMSQAGRQADKDISSTIRRNNSLYQLITSKNPPGQDEEYGYGY